MIVLFCYCLLFSLAITEIYWQQVIHCNLGQGAFEWKEPTNKQRQFKWAFKNQTNKKLQIKDSHSLSLLKNSVSNRLSFSGIQGSSVQCSIVRVPLSMNIKIINKWNWIPYFAVHIDVTSLRQISYIKNAASDTQLPVLHELILFRAQLSAWPGESRCSSHL